MPPLDAHAPTAITQRGSAIWIYTCLSTGAIFLAMVPITSNISACLGEKLGRSAPNLAKSYVAPMVAMNSIPQHDVANGSGHNELALANPIALSSVVAKKPDPSTPGGAGANLISLMLTPVLPQKKLTYITVDELQNYNIYGCFSGDLYYLETFYSRGV